MRYEVMPSAVMVSGIDISCGQSSTVPIPFVATMFGVVVGYIMPVSGGARATATKVELNHIRRLQAPGMLGLPKLLTNVRWTAIGVMSTR